MLTFGIKTTLMDDLRENNVMVFPKLILSLNING